MRVGGTAGIKVDVHVIAASNRDLSAEVAKGTFREDLYYRLNVIPIHLPPLRERKEDIPLLIDFFLKKFSRKEGDRIWTKTVDPAAMQTLVNYPWPGNVRELENMIERLVITAPGNAILVEHLPALVSAAPLGSKLGLMDIPDQGLDLEDLLVTAEKTLLHTALEKAGGVKTDAAKLLGLSFRSFRHRLQKYGVL